MGKEKVRNSACSGVDLLQPICTFRSKLGKFTGFFCCRKTGFFYSNISFAAKNKLSISGDEDVAETISNNIEATASLSVYNNSNQLINAYTCTSEELLNCVLGSLYEFETMEL